MLESGILVLWKWDICILILWNWDIGILVLWNWDIWDTRTPPNRALLITVKHCDPKWWIHAMSGAAIYSSMELRAHSYFLSGHQVEHYGGRAMHVQVISIMWPGVCHPSSIHCYEVRAMVIPTTQSCMYEVHPVIGHRVLASRWVVVVTTLNKILVEVGQTG